MAGITEFIQRKENQGMDFQALWNRVMKGNTIFFENKGMSEDLSGIVSQEEMLFLANLLTRPGLLA